MRIEGVFLGISTPGESVSLERKIESSIFLCIPRDLNILGKSCTTFVIVKIVRNLSRGRSPCQRVNHVKSGVIYFSAFIFSYDTIHVYGTIHTWNRGLTVEIRPDLSRGQELGMSLFFTIEIKRRRIGVFFFLSLRLLAKYSINE